MDHSIILMSYFIIIIVIVIDKTVKLEMWYDAPLWPFSLLTQNKLIWKLREHLY